MNLGNNMEQNIDNETWEEMARDVLHRPGYLESLMVGININQGQSRRQSSQNFLQNMLQNAITNRMAAAEAEEKKRRSMPEWEKYYEFQSWLENVNMRADEQGEQQLEDSNNADGNIMAMDEGQSGEDVDVEEDMDVKMPAADANIEPLNKKAKSDTSEEQIGVEREDEDDQFDINLDNLHKDDNLQRQLDILGPYLFNKEGAIQMGYPHSFFWRALWSVEERHDVHFMAYRWRHFDRWVREDVSVDDPWRWKTFGASDMVLYFPGKFATHDAKCAWAGLVVEESQGNELRPSFDTSWPRDVGIPSLDEVGDIISDILLACAPDKLQVCLYVDKSMIDSFLKLAVVQEEEEESLHFSSFQAEEEFEANSRKLEARNKQPGISSVSKFLSSPYLRKDSPVEVTDQMSEETLGEQLDALKKWLENESPAFGTLHREPFLSKLPPKRFDKLTSGMMNRRRSLPGSEESKNDLVLLATCPNVSKDSDTGEVLGDMCEKLGLHSEIVGIHATHNRNKEIHSYAYIVRDKIGGNIHYPDFSAPLDNVTDEKEKEPRATSVSFTWTSTERLTQDHIKRQQYKKAFETEFVKRAEVRKKASGGRLTFILWPRERSEEEDGYFSRQQPIPITPQNAHIIWLPGDYESMEEKAFDMFLGGSGGGGLCFTRTHDGNLFWQSVMSYFSHHVVYGRDACLLYDDSYEDGGEREYTTIPNEHSLKMLHLLIITRAFIMADGEMFNHEYPEEEIKTFFDKFCEEWRRILLQSVDTLGLGLIEAFSYAKQKLVSVATSMSTHSSGALNDLLGFQALFEGCYQENTPAASHEGLYALLGFHGTWLEEKLNDWKNDGSNWEEVEDFDISFVPNDDDNDAEEDEEEIEDDEEEMEEDDL